MNEVENLKEFDNKQLYLNSFPQKLFVEISRNCNFKCNMCQNKNYKNNSGFNMNFEFYKKVADELFPHVNNIDLRGFGESLVHPQFEKFLDYALQFQKDTGLVTNLGIKNDKLWKKIVKNNLWLGISIDGATKKTFEKIRKNSKFEIILHNLKILQENREKYNINPRRHYFISTIQHENIKEIHGIVQLAKEHGIKLVTFNPVQLPFYDLRRTEFHKKKFEKNMQKALQFAKENEIEIIFHGKIGTGETTEEVRHDINIIKRCKHPWTNLYIAYNGQIGPCNHLMSIPLVLGDLTKNSFRDEWNNNKFQDFRKYNDTNQRFKACNWCYKNRLDHF